MGPLERVHLIKILLWIAKTIDLPIQRKVESTLKVHIKAGLFFLTLMMEVGMAIPYGSIENIIYSVMQVLTV